MKLFKSFLSGTLLLCGFVVASCTQQSLPAYGDAPLEIRLQPSVSVSAPTRLPLEEGATAPFEAHIYKSFTSGDYIGPDVYHEAILFSGSGVQGFSVPQYFPSDDSPVYLCGLSPADEFWTDHVFSDATHSTTVNRQLDGKTDLLACSQQSLNKSEALTSGAFALIFRHLLTKLKIRAVTDADAPYSPSDVWGTIEKVELIAVGEGSPATMVALDLASGAAAYSAPGDAFPVYCMTGNDSYPIADLLFAEQAVAIPTDATDIGYSLIAPFAPTGTDDLTLKVYTTYFPAGVEAKVSLDTTASTAGQTCVVTLTFSTGDKPIIQATSAISAWLPGESVGGVLD